MSDTYKIVLPQFEGPFDLLLFFIERDELDIYNIPISTITDDFLSYIRDMEKLNIDLASEFILVASTLMRIKAKLLIPRREIDDEGNEIDPREELVARLIEYKRYKEILDDLQSLEEDRQGREGRGNVQKELRQIANHALVDAELENLTLFRLLKTFERVLVRFEDNNREVIHTVVQYNYTLRGQKTYLTHFIRRQTKVNFDEIFLTCESRMHAIFNFLAVLELLQLQVLDILPGIGMNNFWIVPGNGKTSEEEE